MHAHVSPFTARTTSQIGTSYMPPVAFFLSCFDDAALARVDTLRQQSCAAGTVSVAPLTFGRRHRKATVGVGTCGREALTQVSPSRVPRAAGSASPRYPDVLLLNQLCQNLHRLQIVQ
jgi:hypothetical protein